MKKHLPAVLIALFALNLAMTFRPAPKPGGFDVAAFGATPVLNNGRVKPLDSVARATLLMIRGKQTLPRDGKRAGAAEWLLDVLFRPDTADQEAVFLIHDPEIIDALGLTTDGKKKYFSFRELHPALETLRGHAAQADAVEPPRRSRFQTAVLNLWERLALYQRLQGTLAPPDSDDFPAELLVYRGAWAAGMEAVQKHQASRAYDRAALEALNAYFQRYSTMADMAYFLPLEPPAGASEDHWQTMGMGLLEGLKTQALPPGVGTYAEIQRAYRREDAGAFNAAVAENLRRLRDAVPRVAANSGAEALFNRVDPFTQGMTIYVVVFLLAALSWLVWPDPLQKASYRLLWLAFAVHSTGLLARIVLQGRPPVTNLYSSAVFVGWAAVLLGIVLERMTRKGFGSVVAAALGFTTLIIAHHLTGQGDTMEMMRAVLDSNFWLATHVVTITIGYSSTFLAGALATVYILRGLLSRSFTKEQAAPLVRMTYGVVCFSLLFSFVGTILGGIWADYSWGRFWGWDPKENGALLIFLWNALILHARWGEYVRERGLMVMAVFGNVITALSWFGVNMLGIGLHSYGFMDKAFLWLSAFVVSQLAVMALASLPPHRWRSQVKPAV